MECNQGGAWPSIDVTRRRGCHRSGSPATLTVRLAQAEEEGADEEGSDGDDDPETLQQRLTGGGLNFSAKGGATAGKGAGRGSGGRTSGGRRSGRGRGKK